MELGQRMGRLDDAIAWGLGEYPFRQNRVVVGRMSATDNWPPPAYLLT